MARRILPIQGLPVVIPMHPSYSVYHLTLLPLTSQLSQFFTMFPLWIFLLWIVLFLDVCNYYVSKQINYFTSWNKWLSFQKKTVFDSDFQWWPKIMSRVSAKLHQLQRAMVDRWPSVYEDESTIYRPVNLSLNSYSVRFPRTFLFQFTLTSKKGIVCWLALSRIGLCCMYISCSVVIQDMNTLIL